MERPLNGSKAFNVFYNNSIRTSLSEKIPARLFVESSSDLGRINYSIICDREKINAAFFAEDVISNIRKVNKEYSKDDIAIKYPSRRYFFQPIYDSLDEVLRVIEEYGIVFTELCVSLDNLGSREPLVKPFSDGMSIGSVDEICEKVGTTIRALRWCTRSFNPLFYHHSVDLFSHMRLPNCTHAKMIYDFQGYYNDIDPKGPPFVVKKSEFPALRWLGYSDRTVIFDEKLEGDNYCKIRVDGFGGWLIVEKLKFSGNDTNQDIRKCKREVMKPQDYEVPKGSIMTKTGNDHNNTSVIVFID